MTIGQKFAKEFKKADLGIVRLEEFVIHDDKQTDSKFSRHAHHMGTTRMSKSPKYGVVDENSKVHDLENLYIAGSSVFSDWGRLQSNYANYSTKSPHGGSPCLNIDV